MDIITKELLYIKEKLSSYEQVADIKLRDDTLYFKSSEYDVSVSFNHAYCCYDIDSNISYEDSCSPNNGYFLSPDEVVKEISFSMSVYCNSDYEDEDNIPW